MTLCIICSTANRLHRVIIKTQCVISSKFKADETMKITCTLSFLFLRIRKQKIGKLFRTTESQLTLSSNLAINFYFKMEKVVNCMTNWQVSCCWVFLEWLSILSALSAQLVIFSLHSRQPIIKRKTNNCVYWNLVLYSEYQDVTTYSQLS